MENMWEQLAALTADNKTAQGPGGGGVGWGGVRGTGRGWGGGATGVGMGGVFRSWTLSLRVKTIPACEQERRNNRDV